MKNFWKSRYYWYKISFYRTSKNSHELSKTIRQGEKVNSSDFLYSEAKKVRQGEKVNSNDSLYSETKKVRQGGKLYSNNSLYSETRKVKVF